jgi:hypothetical protein
MVRVDKLKPKHLGNLSKAIGIYVECLLSREINLGQGYC